MTELGLGGDIEGCRSLTAGLPLHHRAGHAAGGGGGGGGVEDDDAGGRGNAEVESDVVDYTEDDPRST